MNELKGEYKIVGRPTGERYTGMLQYPNCSFKADKDEGVILLENYNDLKQFKPIATEDEDKTIFDLIIPEVKDGE